MRCYPSRGSSADPLRLSRQALDSRRAKIKLTFTHTQGWEAACHPPYTGITGTRSIQISDPNHCKCGAATNRHYVNTLPSRYCMRYVYLAWTGRLMSVMLWTWTEIPHWSRYIDTEQGSKEREKEKWGSLWLTAKYYEVVQVLVASRPSNPDDFMLKVYTTHLIR